MGLPDNFFRCLLNDYVKRVWGGEREMKKKISSYEWFHGLYCELRSQHNIIIISFFLFHPHLELFFSYIHCTIDGYQAYTHSLSTASINSLNEEGRNKKKLNEHEIQSHFPFPVNMPSRMWEWENHWMETSLLCWWQSAKTIFYSFHFRTIKFVINATRHGVISNSNFLLLHAWCEH